ncbi:FBP domain-containing protein [Kocuria sp. JC486]|nr:FBP domain-containing protein [Kocuria sp. JC486]NHU84834.1 FBP domain-containing protein [Kocuria sp. JC486]
MLTYTETQIRKSFINCSKGEAQRINLPKDVLDGWESRIFLAWIDPKAPQNGYMVAETEDGLRGIVLQKKAGKGSGNAQMCQLCMTLHPGSGISLVSIQRPRTKRDHYNSLGTYVCADLACSDYTQGRKKPDGIRQMDETLTPEQRAARTLDNVQGLIGRVQQN